MARTHHPNKYNYDTHPYWKYQWWSKHGPASLRRIYNRIERAREKQALREGRDPPKRHKYIAWWYW
jgi:hypothetical protein